MHKLSTIFSYFAIRVLATKYGQIAVSCIFKALSWRHFFVFTVQKSVKVWLVFMTASDISYPSDMSRKPYDVFENCTDTWHISEGNAWSTLYIPWRVRYEKYQTVLGPTGLERSDIFHNELFSAHNQYIHVLMQSTPLVVRVMVYMQAYTYICTHHKCLELPYFVLITLNSIIGEDPLSIQLCNTVGYLRSMQPRRWNLAKCCVNFLCPGLKGLPGRLENCLPVRLSVIPCRLQKKCNIKMKQSPHFDCKFIFMVVQTSLRTHAPGRGEGSSKM